MDEDIGLVESYIAGDEEAVEKLVVKYQRQIYAVIYRMTKNIEDARDLTQKTFVRAIEGIGGFRRESSFKTWLYRIAINISLNHIKQNRREEVELVDTIMGNQAGTLSKIIENERKSYIKKSLDELPGRQRLALILRAYEGLSCSETAQAMGCTEGAVKAHYHNGVKRLREILKEKGYEIKS